MFPPCTPVVVIQKSFSVLHVEQCNAYTGKNQRSFQCSTMLVYKLKFELYQHVSLHFKFLPIDQASVCLNLELQSQLSLCMVFCKLMYPMVAFWQLLFRFDDIVECLH